MNHPLLVITELFLPTKGGTAVWFDEVYRRIGGKEIHVVTAAVPGSDEHDRDHPNSIHRLRLQRHPWLRPESLAMYLKLLGSSLKLAFTQPVVAVHAGRVLPEGLIGWLVAVCRRVPLLIYAHGEEITTWTQPLKRRVMRFSYRRADCIIANSRFTFDELCKLGVDPARIRTLFPGVDIERFRPGLPAADLRQSIGVGPGQPLLLSVGRLSRRKGFDQVIRALPALIEAGFDPHYALIGIGEEQDHLVRLADELRVRDRLHLLGHVPTDTLARWYNGCELFVMPNREVDGDTEGFGMVFLEAAACGRTAIAGLAGGTGDAVVDGETGLRIDGAELPALTAAIATLLEDATLRQQLATQALSRARRDFSWHSVAQKTVQLLPNGRRNPE
ncbi:MAG TPA: glycosyltransferase family 4 protein [Pseudomonadales bacterium]|nr:glycosyltransferase family 4 protein [Pseudomonadales bacterium]